MRLRHKMALSWKGLFIVLLFYGLFLTGFYFGAHAHGSSEPLVLTAGDISAATKEEPSLLVLARPASAKENLTPQAVIYCTHTSEEYAGQKRQNGVAGGVFTVAESLANCLEQLGIGVILLENIFDAPDWNAAYGNSLSALEQVKQQYPQIELFIDIHRDSDIPGLNTHLTTTSGAFARMLLIIGSDTNLEHPKWQQNKAFAQELHQELEALLPGIMREPKIYNGRYNQHIGTKAILVEMGSTTNSVAEAQKSAELLAQALANIL